MSDPVFDMPDATHTFEERGAWLVKRLASDFELEPFQAAGIVGNLGFESGGFKQLQEIGPQGGRGGYGWAQWTGPRRVMFEGWAKGMGLAPSSDAANYGYLVFELRGEYKHTIEALRTTRTDADAVFSVGQTYERPGGTTATFLPGFDQRVRYARRALAGAGGPLPVPGTDTAAPVTAAVRALQTALRPYGYAGAIDGDPGGQTSAAIAEFRRRQRG
jgi:hypothetical protein